MALNGRLPATMLGVIPGTGQRFPLPFIAQVAALRAAFQARFGKPLVITDAYRPYQGNQYAQVETMLARYKPAAEFARITGGASTAGRKFHTWNGERRYLLPGKAQVAFPGKSRHGDDVHPALDLGSGVNRMGSPEHQWIVEHAPQFGFRWPAEWARAAGEPWHIEGTRVVPVSDLARVVPNFTAPTVTPGAAPLPLEADMDLTTQNITDIRAAVRAELAGIPGLPVLGGETLGGNLGSIRPEIASIPGAVAIALEPTLAGIWRDVRGADVGDLERHQEAMGRLEAFMGALAAGVDAAVTRAVAGAPGQDGDEILALVRAEVATVLDQARLTLPPANVSTP